MANNSNIKMSARNLYAPKFGPNNSESWMATADIGEEQEAVSCFAGSLEGALDLRSRVIEAYNGDQK